MRGKRAKEIKKLVKKNDAVLLFAIRKNYGTKTINFTENRIYKCAKKIWTKNKSF